MIVLSLGCDLEHKFDGWFRSAAEFTRQQQEGLLCCPVCDSKEIKKFPSGPHIVRGRDVSVSKTESAAEPAEMTDVPTTAATSKGWDALPQAVAKLMELVKVVVENSENVGNRFADEARKIHKDEAPARNIHGTATRQETKELLDEGISVLPLPLPPRSEMH